MDLIAQLEERRAALVKLSQEALAKSGESLANGGPKEERAAHDQAADAAIADIKEIDGRLVQLREQRDREAKAAELRKGDATVVDDGRGARASGVTVTAEPQIYGEGSGHSYFLDMARCAFNKGDGDGGVSDARDRQARHQVELRVEMPRRQEARRKAADRKLERVLSGEALEDGNRRERRMSRLERRTYERFLAAGHNVYEQRIISRTDGQGGYEVPPLWLVDEYIPYLRAGRTFADLWHNFPLPSGTDSINIPRLTLGTATGPQPGDGAPVPGRDIADNFVQARVMTVAGQQDAAMQLLDQSPLNYDEIIFGDLAADYNMQFSGQLMIGSGYPQLNGLYQAGTLGGTAGASTSGVVTLATGLTTAQWTGTASYYQAVAQLVSQISRTRFLPPSALITNPMVWYALASTVDTTGRPLVVPSQQGANFNQAAGDMDGPITEGLVGHIMGLPWWIDPNIPTTFGGTVAPSISTISNGSTAAVPGSGGNPDFTPAIAARFADLFVWEGDTRTRVLTEVLSGNLAVRFQLYAYAASMPNRYQDSSGNLVSYGNANSTTAVGAALSTGTAGGLVGF